METVMKKTTGRISRRSMMKTGAAVIGASALGIENALGVPKLPDETRRAYTRWRLLAQWDRAGVSLAQCAQAGRHASHVRAVKPFRDP